MATATLGQHSHTLISLAVAVAVFALWLRRHHRKHQQPRARPLTAHRKMIAAGRKASAVTGGRKPQGWGFQKPPKKKSKQLTAGKAG
jgi:hypothetical protein